MYHHHNWTDTQEAIYGDPDFNPDTPYECACLSEEELEEIRAKLKSLTETLTEDVLAQIDKIIELLSKLSPEDLSSIKDILDRIVSKEEGWDKATETAQKNSEAITDIIGRVEELEKKAHEKPVFDPKTISGDGTSENPYTINGKLLTKDEYITLIQIMDDAAKHPITKEKLQEIEEELQRLNKANVSEESAIRDNTRRLDELEDKVGGNTTSIENVRKELNTKIENNKNSIDSLGSQVRQNTNDIKELKEKVGEIDTEITEEVKKQLETLPKWVEVEASDLAAHPEDFNEENTFYYSSYQE